MRCITITTTLLLSLVTHIHSITQQQTFQTKNAAFLLKLNILPYETSFIQKTGNKYNCMDTRDVLAETLSKITIQIQHEETNMLKQCSTKQQNITNQLLIDQKNIKY